MIRSNQTCLLCLLSRPILLIFSFSLLWSEFVVVVHICQMGICAGRKRCGESDSASQNGANRSLTPFLQRRSILQFRSPALTGPVGGFIAVSLEPRGYSPWSNKTSRRSWCVSSFRTSREEAPYLTVPPPHHPSVFPQNPDINVHC